MRKMKANYNGNDRVTITTDKKGEWLSFYYEKASTLKKSYLYSRKFSLSIFLFFKNGKTMRELMSFHNWDKRKLAKLMEYKLFRAIEYVLAEEDIEEEMEENATDITIDYMEEYRKYQEEKRKEKLKSVRRLNEDTELLAII